jgi:putative transcriptional regulator
MAESDQRRNIGAEILDGIREIKRGEVGRTVHYPPIADIRRKVGLSQAEFARLLSVSVRTLQEWEQGRRAPSGPARTLLAIADKNPQALLDVAV